MDDRFPRIFVPVLCIAMLTARAMHLVGPHRQLLIVTPIVHILSSCTLHAMSCFMRHFCNHFWFAAHRWPRRVRHTHHRYRRRAITVHIPSH